MNLDLIEQEYYQELDVLYQYEVALEQWVSGELDEKPEKPFLVFIS
jgi:hypothetical protein